MLFRNRRLARATAGYLLLQTFGSLLAPLTAVAGNGPNQPEYTSYNPGSNDLVDLLTGDFAYTIPLLEVPGPERSFPIPLSYKSGIKLEQEASWVGLGWTLNAGAISRTPNGYPDDAAGDQVYSHFLKHVGAEETVNYIPGVWTQTTELYTGKLVGRVDLLGLASVNWDNDGIAGGDLVGLSYQKGEGVSGDPVRMTMAAVTIMSMGGAFGGAKAAQAALGQKLGENLAGQVLSSAAAGGLGLGKLSGSGGAGNQLNIYQFNTGSFFNNFVPLIKGGGPATEYTYSLYGKNTTETTYGSLYFGKMSQRTSALSHDRIQVKTSAGAVIEPVEFVNARYCQVALDHPQGPGRLTEETAADIHQPAGTAYQNVDGPSKPISIAHDYFSVMGEGASGLIRPYRLDVGSVAPAAVQSEACDADTKFMTVPFQDYKVGFRYEGDLSNTYDYHQNTDPTDIGFQVSADKRSITITDQRLFDAARRTAPARKGIVNGSTGPRFVQGKHVQWFSNREIEQMGANQTARGFLDFAPPVASGGTVNTFRHILPPDGIGAFQVTTEDGTTYHYSLPTYEYKTNTYSNEINGAYKTLYGLPGEYYKKEGLPTATNPHGGYATTWLLTAITSADYLDRNSSGTVDALDWGGWVKLEYGKLSSHYKWRQPYVGSSYSDEKTYIDYANYLEGYRESYYLDRISTRSHTALFVKSVREDGKGHFDPDYGQHPAAYTQLHDLGINDQFPAASLRLDEIILLDNATLTQLQTSGGVPAAGQSAPVPIFSNDTDGNAATFSCGSCGDDLAGVLDGHDLTADTRVKRFVEANAIKRVHFNYDYALCRGTPNSFTYALGQRSSLPPMGEAQASVNRGGKLTLKSVSFFGPTVEAAPTKITPDFVFGYDVPGLAETDYNPAYQKDKWDAFGMYNPLGKYDVISHQPNRQGYAAPWTMTSITSPLGGTTRINYERDEYAHISESPTDQLSFRSTNQSDGDDNITLTLLPDELAKINNDLASIIHVGDELPLSGFVKYTCTVNDGGYATKKDYRDNFKSVQQVVAVGANTVQVAGSFPTNQCQGEVFIQSCIGKLALALNKPGGDVRVAAITNRESSTGQLYETRYKYTSNAPVVTNSTGVIAQAAPFTFLTALTSGKDIYDYPQTPVLYSSVKVLHGPFRNNDETQFDYKEEFEFFTPNSTMISRQIQDAPGGAGNVWNQNSQQFDATVNFTVNQIKVRTGLIGRPKAVRSYNRRGQVELSTEFIYATEVNNPDNIAKQGYYTEGVLANHMLNSNRYSINRTTKQYEPVVLVGTRSMRNGIAASSRAVLFDFFTGQPIETAVTNSLGKIYHTRTVPAYSLPGQEGMGPKGTDGSGRNMLVQTGASYSYLEIAGGQVYNPLDPFNPATTRMLSAGVQTWQPTWTTYREPDIAGSYQDVAGQVPVWRQAATYVWQSPLLNDDGSFKGFTPFSWTGTPSKQWIKTDEVVRYDHYSHPVESRDVNGKYIAQKMGYFQAQPLISGTNARYTELAFSGAEDPLPVGSATHFGGEVVAGAGGSITTQVAHTGFNSYQAAPGGKGFVYRAQIGRDVDAGKTYRVSVWAHEAALGGKLYASLNGNRVAETTRASTTTKKAGSWYLLTMLVTMPVGADGQTIEMGSLNEGSAPASFDDFRLAPLTSTVASQVYDPRSNRVLYSLDNDNLFTRYEYTPVGRLKRVYKETLDGTGAGPTAQKLVKEYDYNYAQLNAPTWVSTDYRCKPDYLGNFTGEEERYVVDINPLSPTKGSGKWESNGASNNCLPPPCPVADPIGYSSTTGPFTDPYNTQASAPTMLYHNQCMQAKLTSSKLMNCTVYQGGTYVSRNQTQYTWTMPDGSIIYTYSICR